jgi:hypothetical protein
VPTFTRGARAPLFVGAALALAGCVSSARQVEYYDEGCSIQSRKMVFETQPLGSLNCTQSRECLATTLVIGAGSTLIAGSIVVVGNTVYWMERVGQCIARIPGK